MKKVIIIGAGPAGLTAGYELLRNKKNEYEVTILEETEGFSVEIVDVYPGTKYEDTCIHYFVPFENQVIPYE